MNGPLPELLASRSVIRDPSSDPLITPQNSALLVIDYQPAQVGAVQRDWARQETVADVVEIVLTERLLKE